MKWLNPFASDKMLVTVAIWMCTLPITFFLVFNLFGVKTASVVTVMLSLLLFGVCWGICGWEVFRE